MIVDNQIVSDLASSTASVFAGTLPLIILLFGLGIAIYVVRQLLSLLPK